MDIIITIGAYITAIGTIIGAINKLLDKKLEKVYNTIENHEKKIYFLCKGERFYGGGIPFPKGSENPLAGRNFMEGPGGTFRNGSP